MGHFSLNVDPDSIETAGAGLTELGNHLTTRSTEIKSTNGEIPESDWKGAARTSIMKEVEALGNQAARFGPMFTNAGAALKTLATTARTAEDVTLKNLNDRWDGAQSTYNSAIDKANTARTHALSNLGPEATPADRKFAREDADAARTSAYSQAYNDRVATENKLNGEYQELVTSLQTAFTTAGRTLADNTVVPVSDQTVSDFVKTGKWPGDLGGDDFLAKDGLTLVRDKHDMAEGEQAAKDFNEWMQTGPHTPQEIADYRKRLKIDSPAFRAGFLNNLSLQSLRFMQTVAHHGVDAEGAKAYGTLITDIGKMMAAGSNANLQGDYQVRPSFYEQWRKQAKEGIPEGEGMLFMAELVQAGQGGKATWDSNMLAGIAKDTVQFEQDMRAKHGEQWNWVQIWGSGYPVTEAFSNQIGTAGIPGRADPLAMIFDAVQYDKEAAYQILTRTGSDGKHVPNMDLLHYLYDGRREQVGMGLTWGDALGGVISAGTQFSGGGGPGSREYVAADIVGDFVHFFGSDPTKLWPGMEQDVVDILPFHIQAVNAANGKVQWTGDEPHVGDPNGILARDRLTLAVLQDGDLNGLMSSVFGLDYYGQDGKHPLFQQFAAVQTAAYKKDFIDAANNPKAPPGLLEQIIGEHGAGTKTTVEWFRQGMVGQAESEDEANKAAREAADWVLGLATDRIPLDKLGPAGDVAGAAIDPLKSWALDLAGFEETDHAGETTKTVDDVYKDWNTQNALVHLNWLDETGRLGAASPDAWAQAHPDKRAFMEQDPSGRWVLKDAATMYQQREDDPEAWNQFVDYWKQQGDPKLRDEDFYEAFELGLITG
jgi:hypothetical protein